MSKAYIVWGNFSFISLKSVTEPCRIFLKTKELLKNKKICLFQYKVTLKKFNKS